MPSRSGTIRSLASASDDAVIRPFERSLPMLLMRTREAVMHRFRPHLRHHGLTEQQWRILRVLAEREAMEMQDLATYCCIQAPSLSRTIPALDERGLVRRKAHASDQRRVVVELAEAGRDLFAAMSEESERIYAGLAAEVGEKRMARLYNVVEDFLERIDIEPSAES